MGWFLQEILCTQAPPKYLGWTTCNPKTTNCCINGTHNSRSLVLIEKIRTKKNTHRRSDSSTLRGQSNSTLENGERLLIIIRRLTPFTDQQATNRHCSLQEPFSCEVKDGKLDVSCIRQKPRETVKVTFDRISWFSTQLLTLRILLHASERHAPSNMLNRSYSRKIQTISWKKRRTRLRDIYGEDKDANSSYRSQTRAATKENVLQLANTLNHKSKNNHNPRCTSCAKPSQRCTKTLVTMG